MLVDRLVRGFENVRRIVDVVSAVSRLLFVDIHRLGFEVGGRGVGVQTAFLDFCLMNKLVRQPIILFLESVDFFLQLLDFFFLAVVVVDRQTDGVVLLHAVKDIIAVDHQAVVVGRLLAILEAIIVLSAALGQLRLQHVDGVDQIVLLLAHVFDVDALAHHAVDVAESGVDVFPRCQHLRYIIAGG